DGGGLGAHVPEGDHPTTCYKSVPAPFDTLHYVFCGLSPDHVNQCATICFPQTFGHPSLMISAADEQSDVSFARAHKCFFTDCTAVLACICQLLALTLVGVTLFPAKEAHSFIIVDVLRTIDDGNHFSLGTNGLTGTGVLDNFFEVALR